MDNWGISLLIYYQNMFSEDCLMDIPDEFQITSPTCFQSSSRKKLTMGLKNYSDIKSAYKKYQKPTFSNQQYTFKPKTNSKGKQRSFDKFIQNQEKFLNDKNSKIEKLKTQISQCIKEDSLQTPKKHEKRGENGSQEEVFSRLSRKKNHNQKAIEENLFIPKILKKSKQLKRQETVDNLLYSDAKRRKQQKEFIEEEVNRKGQKKPQINRRTNELVCKKIYQEFVDLVGGEESIAPIMAVSVISQIFNIELNPNKGTENEELCHLVLTYLIQSSDEVVKVQKFWYFILAILGNFDNESIFSIREQTQIYKNLSYFYMQRLTKEKKLEEEERPEFKPETLKCSIKLAENHREKVLTQINDFLENNKTNINVGNVLKIEDLYILDSIRRKAELSAKKKENDQRQMDECSFRPSIERKKYTQRLSLRQNFSSREKKANGIKRSTELKQNKRKEPIKVILKGRKKKAETEKEKEKLMMRMSVGRKIREYNQLVLNRGYPTEVGNWIEYQKREKKKIKQTEDLLRGYESKKRFQTCRD